MPPVDKLQKVADYFDVSTDYLLGRTAIKNLELIKNGGQEEAKEIADLVKKL